MISDEALFKNNLTVERKSHLPKLIFRKDTFIIKSMDDEVSKLVIKKIKTDRLTGAIYYKGFRFEVVGVLSSENKKRVFVYSNHSRICRIDYVEYDGIYLKFDDGDFAHIDGLSFYTNRDKEAIILKVNEKGEKIDVFPSILEYKEKALLISLLIIYWVFVWES